MSMENVSAKMVGTAPTAVRGYAKILSSVKTVRKPVIVTKTTQKCAILGRETAFVSQAGLVSNAIVLARCSSMDISVSTPVIVNLELSARQLTVNAFVCQDSSERNVNSHVLKESTVKTVENPANVKTTLRVMVRLDNVCVSLAGRTTNVIVLVTRTPSVKTVQNHASVTTTPPVIRKTECAHVRLDGLDAFAIRNVTLVTMAMDVS